MAFHAKHILHGDRHAEQWFLRVGYAASQLLIGSFCLRECVRRVVAKESFDSSVNTLDLIEARPRRFAGGAFSFRELACKPGNGELVQHEKTWTRITRISANSFSNTRALVKIESYSTIFGTRNRPPAPAG